MTSGGPNDETPEAPAPADNEPPVAEVSADSAWVDTVTRADIDPPAVDLRSNPEWLDSITESDPGTR